MGTNNEMCTINKINQTRPQWTPNEGEVESKRAVELTAETSERANNVSGARTVDATKPLVVSERAIFGSHKKREA